MATSARGGRVEQSEGPGTSYNGIIFTLVPRRTRKGLGLQV